MESLSKNHVKKNTSFLKGLRFFSSGICAHGYEDLVDMVFWWLSVRCFHQGSKYSCIFLSRCLMPQNESRWDVVCGIFLEPLTHVPPSGGGKGFPLFVFACVFVCVTHGTSARGCVPPAVLDVGDNYVLMPVTRPWVCMATAGPQNSVGCPPRIVLANDHSAPAPHFSTAHRPGVWQASSYPE